MGNVFTIIKTPKLVFDKNLFFKSYYLINQKYYKMRLLQLGIRKMTDYQTKLNKFTKLTKVSDDEINAFKTKTWFYLSEIELFFEEKYLEQIVNKLHCKICKFILSVKYILMK